LEKQILDNLISISIFKLKTTLISGVKTSNISNKFMRHYSYSLFLVIFLSLNYTFLKGQTSLPSSYSYDIVIPTFTDSEIRDRLNRMSSAVAPPRFTPAVKSYINTYTVKKRKHTEAMLGRISIYFPMFEKYLLESNLPVDLKYLSIVESALNPKAVSRSGAVGLWQFMPPTGKEQGLKINSTVDERKDPHKSTLAAARYLKKQYKRYQNWELALAAYNGGPGRVNRAIKRGRSKNFWRIKRYLPKETQNYVPAFIAATYVVNYYPEHNLVPVYPEIDLQLTELLKIYKKISFYEIEKMTGVPMHLIEHLNPSYKKKYIPASRKGSNLVLPQQYMGNLLSHLGRPDSEVKRINVKPIPAPVMIDYSENKNTSVHTVFAGETYEGIAAYYGVTTADLKTWNQRSGYTLKPGRELRVYTPKMASSPKFNQLNPIAILDMSNVISKSSNSIIKPKLPSNQPAKTEKRVFPRLKYLPAKSVLRDNEYLYYLIGKDETLYEIAEKFNDVSMNDILVINNVSDPYELKSGRKIKVKRK